MNQYESYLDFDIPIFSNVDIPNLKFGCRNVDIFLVPDSRYLWGPPKNSEVFCSHHFRVLQCDTGYAKYNQHDKQDRWRLRTSIFPQSPLVERFWKQELARVPACQMLLGYRMYISKIVQAFNNFFIVVF